jgi:KDO2-lipid IV(A) lauroyltransferase
VVVKEIKGRMMDEFITRGRTRYGNHMLPRQNSFRDCLRVLKANGILGIMLDPNMIRSEGIFVEFLGKPACTTPGLAFLSAQSGAPVVPMACIRVPGGHEVRIGEPFPAPPDREPETIRRATQEYSHAVEDAIRADPDQWIWIHRRWRTRPLAYAGEGRTGDRSSG